MIPSISVALCTFNGEAYLRAQVMSILGQTTLPDEIVVGDDGSSDSTLEVLADCAAQAATRGVNFTVLAPGPRLGVVRNFERVLTVCVGEVIFLCDQDDRWRPDRIAIALSAFRADPDLLLVNCDADLIDGDDRPLGLTLFEGLGVTTAERESVRHGNGFDVLIRRNIVTGAATALRQTLVGYAVPFPEDWIHDEWLAIIAAALGNFQLLDDRSVEYRQHGSNQIGVEKRTFRYRLARMLSGRSSRYVTLARRAERLNERLSDLTVSRDVLQRAREKLRFEQTRSVYPARRISRLPAIFASWRRGDYTALSSSGSLDAVRDFVQRH